MKYIEKFNNEKEFKEWLNNSVKKEESVIGTFEVLDTDMWDYWDALYDEDISISDSDYITIDSDIWVPCFEQSMENSGIAPRALNDALTVEDIAPYAYLCIPENFNIEIIPVLKGASKLFTVKDGYMKIPKQMLLENKYYIVACRYTYD